MAIEKFEDVIAWQKSKQLSILVYKIFRANRDFSFKDQIQRAAISIPNNIAEGFERKSNKELRQFLYIAKGSCGEVRSMLLVALELEYLTKDQFAELHTMATEVSRILAGFIKKL